jgi:SAM-dependent methyltransferase
MSPADDSGVNMAVNMALLSGALHLDEQTGIWRANAAAAADLSYPADHNAACFRLEDGSFWFTHRNRCIIAAVRRFPPDGFILDIGGGNGFVAQGLIDAGYETALLEPGSAGAQNAKQSRRVPTVINATIDEAAIRPGSVPNIGLFDVLEHIGDDRPFVRRLHDILRPGGFLYLTVPAFDWLWSTADVDAMHYRRYTRRTITDVLSGGFEVLYLTYLFQRLVPLSMLMRALPYRIGLARPGRAAELYKREHAVQRRRLAGVLSWMLDHEVAAIAAGRSLVVGSSLLVVARREQ